MTYSERLKVPALWLVVAALGLLSLAVAVFAYLPVGQSAAFTGLAVVGAAVGLYAYGRTPLTVDGEAFTAGRYRLERSYIADAEAITGADAAHAVGPGADYRAFLFTRPFIRDVVKVTLDDPADPHPYWLVSTRDAAALAAALTGKPLP